MKIYREYRPGVRRTGPIMLMTADEIYGRSGFISVYGFDEETAKDMRDKGGSYGLRHATLYSSCLFVDVDDNDLAAAEIERTLVGRQIKFDKYHTGGRGWHFHIYIAEMIGKDVVYRQRRWVQQNCPGADLSLYKSSGIIRLPGTYHSKNPGKRKELISQHDGDILEITTKGLPPVIGNYGISPEAHDDTEAILDDLLMRRLGSGGRNDGVYKLAMLFNKLDYGLEYTLNILTKYNATMVCPALGHAELASVIKSAYRGV
jgi:hypothetical protein